MKRHEHLWRAGLLMSLALLCSSANAGPAHTALRAEVEMQADTVLLMHLLPEHVSEELKRSVQGITLGAAPRPGSTRRLLRSTVVSALEANGISATAFDVPDCIRIRRSSRELTGEEVWSAIQTSLSNTPSQTMAGLKPENIRFDSSIVVPAGGAQLRLSQVRYDPLLGEARFRLVSSGTASILPFYVTAKLESPVSMPSSEANRLNRQEEGLAPDLILVDPKRPATLRLHSANSETMLRVQPLTLGRLGEVVPVRLLSNRRTLKARVINFGLLDAAF